MIVELSTTSLGLAMGLGGASVLTGSTSSMDGVRKFFLSEKSDIDSVLQNSRDFEEKYSIGGNDDFVEKPSNDSGEDNSPSSVLGSALGGASAVAVEGVKSWFNYKYLVVALGVAFVYKLLTGKNYGGSRI